MYLIELEVNIGVFSGIKLSPLGLGSRLVGSAMYLIELEVNIGVFSGTKLSPLGLGIQAGGVSYVPDRRNTEVNIRAGHLCHFKRRRATGVN